MKWRDCIIRRLLTGTSNPVPFLKPLSECRKCLRHRMLAYPSAFCRGCIPGAKPEEFSRDPEWLARFQCEAEALAVLNRFRARKEMSAGDEYEVQCRDGCPRKRQYRGDLSEQEGPATFRPN